MLTNALGSALATTRSSWPNPYAFLTVAKKASNFNFIFNKVKFLFSNLVLPA